MPTTPESIAAMRSLLAVPGHRPDRFEKAATSGADEILLDLEDAVGPSLKPIARTNVSRWLDAGGRGVVRLNGPVTPWYDDDVAMLAGRPCAVMLPKASSGRQVGRLVDALGPRARVIPVLETAVGILDARDVCAASGIARLIFGNADFATELGIDHADRPALVHARAQLALVSAASSLPPPMDGITTVLGDDRRLRGDAEHAASLGFGGKACVHPSQIDIVNSVFSPTSDDIRWADEVLASSGDGSVAVLDGNLVARPVVERARSIQRRARIHSGEAAK